MERHEIEFETKDGHIISEQTVICGYSKQIGVYGVAAVANALAAEGAGVSESVYRYRFRIMDKDRGFMDWKSLSGKSAKKKDLELLEVKSGKSPVLRLHRLS